MVVKMNFRRRTLIVVFVILLATVPLRAQFRGFFSPQTGTQQVFNAISTVQCSTQVRNVGGASHIIYYTVTGTAVNSLRISIQGSFNGTNYFRISDEAKQTGVQTALNEGAVFANGYYPFVRVCLDNFVVGSGSPTLSAWYSSTSVSIPNRTGIFSDSNVNTHVLGFAEDITIGIAVDILPSSGSTGGTVFFCSSTVSSGRTYEITLTVTPFTSANNTFSSDSSYIYSVFPDSLGCQLFVVPATAADWIRIELIASPAPGAGTQIYNLLYILGETHVPQGVSLKIPAQTGVGTTRSIVTALMQPGGTGSEESSSFTQPMVITKHTIHLRVTGGPATCTYRLEGSLDPDEVTPEWFDLSGTLTCTTSTMVHIVDRPVMRVRGNLLTLTGGTSPTVQLRYLGVQ